MKNLNKVEAYFNNELNDSEKNDFLNEVESNAELKNEYNFQKDIINGIKEARKAELKAMLNQIPISATNTASTGLFKLMYAGVATILLGTSLWYYTNSEDIISDKENSQNKVAEQVSKEQTKPNISKPSTKSTEDVEFEEKGHQKAKTNISKAERKPVIAPNVPTSEDVIDSNVVTEENLEIPDAVSNSSINISSKVNVTVKLKKKYNFHYLYSQNGIVLYGDFKEGLFEILELNKEESTNYYLYYKSNYYYIKDSSGKIKALKPVTDKSLKLKLEALR